MARRGPIRAEREKRNAPQARPNSLGPWSGGWRTQKAAVWAQGKVYFMLNGVKFGDFVPNNPDEPEGIGTMGVSVPPDLEPTVQAAVAHGVCWWYVGIECESCGELGWSPIPNGGSARITCVDCGLDQPIEGRIGFVSFELDWITPQQEKQLLDKGKGAGEMAWGWFKERVKQETGEGGTMEVCSLILVGAAPKDRIPEGVLESLAVLGGDQFDAKLLVKALVPLLESMAFSHMVIESDMTAEEYRDALLKDQKMIRTEAAKHRTDIVGFQEDNSKRG